MTSTNSTQQLDFHKEMVELISEFEDLYEVSYKLEKKERKKEKKKKRKKTQIHTLTLNYTRHHHMNVV